METLDTQALKNVTKFWEHLLNFLMLERGPILDMNNIFFSLIYLNFKAKVLSYISTTRICRDTPTFRYHQNTSPASNQRPLDPRHTPNPHQAATCTAETPAAKTETRVCKYINDLQIFTKLLNILMYLSLFRIEFLFKSISSLSVRLDFTVKYIVSSSNSSNLE